LAISAEPRRIRLDQARQNDWSALINARVMPICPATGRPVNRNITRD
jgi:hypothetical protein